MTRPTLYGAGSYMSEFEGVINNLERRYKETTSDWARWEIEQVMTACKCPDCNGTRLKPEILSVISQKASARLGKQLRIAVVDITAKPIINKNMSQLLDFGRAHSDIVRIKDKNQ